MITSLLQNDWYAMTMSYPAWKYMRDVEVGYELKNRSLEIRLTDTVNVKELRRDIDDIRALRFEPKDIQFMREQNCFPEGYLEFLEDLRLCEVEVEDRNGWLSVSYHDVMPVSIFWETPLLQLVMAHHMRGAVAAGDHANLGAAHTEGMKRVGRKIDIYKENPGLPGFMEFGTRRPFPGVNYAGEYQERVLGRLLAEIPDKVLGTSNPYLARMYGIPVKGTQAHQWAMVSAANILSFGMDADPLATAQSIALDFWEDCYKDHPELLCFLPDTFTTPFFLKHIEPERIMRWNKWRQDSGDPFRMGDLIINKLQELEIDPMSQLLLPSNGLDINTMLALHYHFDGRIPHAYGWGGNLMNDTGYVTPQIVIKPAWLFNASGHRVRTIKLSDDLAKSSGDRDDVNRFKELARV